jgi:hypothetical protein
MTALDLKLYLKHHIFKNHDYCDSIIEILVDQLDKTDRGVENLYRACLGHYEKLEDYNLKVGDLKLIKPENLFDWDFDKEKMKRDSMILGGRMEVKVEGIDITNKRSILVKYQYIDKSTDQLREKVDNVHVSHLEDDPLSGTKVKKTT